MLTRATHWSLSVLATGLLVVGDRASAAPTGTAFTYQGRLKSAGAPLNATADFQFSLWDDPGTGSPPAGGTQIGSTQPVSNVPVSGGLFTVQLNAGGEFGATAFNGDARWLQIAVRSPAGSGTFTTLSPRQPITGAPYARTAASLALPLAGAANVSGPAIDLTNSSAAGIAFSGHATASSGTNFGVLGMLAGASGVDLAGNHSGVWGDSSVGNGVIGTSGALFGAGVLGKSNNVGVYGTNPTGGAGVYGDSVSGTGVYGACVSGNGVYGTSASSNGVFGFASGTSGVNYGVFGRTASSSGVGVWGEATNFATGTIGVKGVSPAGIGVYGVAALAVGGSAGLYGTTLGSGGTGVIGVVNGASSTGVLGTTDQGFGIHGTATSGTGVFGQSSSGPGVSGYSASHFGIIGTRTNGSGVDLGGRKSAIWGDASSGDGVIGTSAELYGAGVTGKCNNVGVLGINPTGGAGVYGTTSTGYGVYGVVTGSSTNAIAVYGVNNTGLGSAVAASATGGATALFAGGADGSKAGIFHGDVAIAGGLSKLSGSFQIDHPLDPANKYLRHSFVESPDMMDIYNGNVTTDEKGYAEITLPDWFEALNKDFRYELSVLDDADSDTFVQAKVVKRIHDNRFTIRTSHPHTDVSWQVTGIRQDAWANAHRIVVEEVKPEAERGKFLAPEVQGQPAELGIHYAKPVSASERPSFERKSP
jgi:hypothetical protein